MEEYKTIFEEKLECPHCKKKIIIRKTREVIQAPVKGEYEDTTVVEKDNQTTLVDNWGKKKPKGEKKK